MTPKEKAIELVEKYMLLDYNSNLSNKKSKQCTLICVDEIIQLRKGYFDCTNPMQDEKYWQQVKEEINNL